MRKKPAIIFTDDMVLDYYEAYEMWVKHILGPHMEKVYNEWKIGMPDFSDSFEDFCDLSIEWNEEAFKNWTKRAGWTIKSTKTNEQGA